MKTFPVNLLLDGRLAVVVGAGKVAARKAAALLAAGARLRVVALTFCDELEALDGVEKIRAEYAPALLAGASIVIAATDDDDVNRRVSMDARAAAALVNVVDAPELCDFTFPAVAHKGDVSIAVSTGGASPTLARRLKDELADSLDDSYADLARILAAVRSEAIARITGAARRRKYFESLADDRFLEILKSRGCQEGLLVARRIMDEMVALDERGNGDDA